MSAARFSSRPVDCGHGYVVEFQFRPGGLFCEWTPDVPGSDAPASVFERYEEARDAFIAARLKRLLGNVGPITTELRR